MDGVREITKSGAKFIDGQEKEFDSIILATGYKSNVPVWLKVSMTNSCLFLIFFYLGFILLAISCLFQSLTHIVPYKTFLIPLCKRENLMAFVWTIATFWNYSLQQPENFCCVVMCNFHRHVRVNIYIHVHMGRKKI